MKGRYFKIFLPILIGVSLLVGGLLVTSQKSLATGDWFEFCEDWPWLCDDASPLPCPGVDPEWFDGPFPTPSPCPSPSPSPSPLPSPTLPPVGGPGPTISEGGAQAPSCPVDGRPQKVDQVWFSDVTDGKVTVHWANKGDTAGYHLAYGITPNQWLWGVEVGNVNEYTLDNLPQGADIWLTVIPLGNNKCPGESSEPAKVLGVKTLADTGIATARILFLAGFSFLVFGLWQLQGALSRKEKKAVH